MAEAVSPSTAAHPATDRDPARTEPFVSLVTRRIGGWGARHALPDTRLSVPLLVTLVTGTITWIILALRQLPCRITTTNAPNTFYRLCYSDVPVLYQSRHLQDGANPYGLEYPVLTAWFVQLTRGLTQLFGGAVGPKTPWPAALNSLHLFTDITSILLWLCFLGLIAAHVLMQPSRRWDAMMVAAAPVVAAAGVINWDMFCLLLTALSLLAWSRRMPAVAGVLLGLGIAAKLYPFVLLVPLLALCLRERKIQAGVSTLLGTLAGFGLPNVVIAALYPTQWRYFWTFNADRGPDLGSLWYVAKLMGAPVPDHISLPVATLDVVGALIVAAICLFAPRRPRLGQVAYVMVAWFCIVNKVYSPQYVLWLLPFVVLARPRWRDYLIWTVAELAYFCAVWGHLAGTLTAPGSQDDRLYWMAVLVRVAAELWLAAMVIIDILDPSEDPVRADGVDDPIGGILIDVDESVAGHMVSDGHDDLAEDDQTDAAPVASSTGRATTTAIRSEA